MAAKTKANQPEEITIQNIVDYQRSKRIIKLWGEVTAKSSQSLVSEMEYLADVSKEPIYLHICSDGGYTDYSAAILDQILNLRAAKVEVHTVAMGIAASSAADILAIGTPGYRYATKHTTIMLHPASVELSKDYLGQQETIVKFSTKQSDLVNRVIAKACGKRSFIKFMQAIDKGLWLNATEAIKFGIIDQIWTG